MRRFFLIACLSAGLSACGVGAPAPARPDPALEHLFSKLSQAEDAASAAPLEAEIWARWADSGSPSVNILLERANAAHAVGDSDLALRFLDRASALAPDFAEPWNRRATLAYDADDHPGAIAAIMETLKRQPRHFAAMGALGLIYEELGQDRKALEAFRSALAVHPFYELALQGVRRIEPRVDGREA